MMHLNVPVARSSSYWRCALVSVLNTLITLVYLRRSSFQDATQFASPAVDGKDRMRVS